MTDPSYQRRFQRAADASPQAFQGYTQQRLGVPPHVAMQMLAIHRSLTDGNKISPAQARQLIAAHPETNPHDINNLIGKLNAQSPGQRPDLYLGILAGDTSVITGDFANAGPVYKELQAFTKTYHTESMAAEIHAKREERADPELLAKVIERPRHDPLSTRALIEAQIDGKEGKMAREIADWVDQGDPVATRVLAGNLADRGERALETLSSPDEKTSTRDSVAAAFDFHEVESIAQDQGLVTQEDA